MDFATSSNPIRSGDITFESHVILRGNSVSPKILDGLLKASAQREILDTPSTFATL
jgi:hypothetical protein